MNQDAVSVWILSVHFRYYWPEQEKRGSFHSFWQSKWDIKIKMSVLIPTASVLFYGLTKNQPNAKDKFKRQNFE